MFILKKCIVVLMLYISVVGTQVTNADITTPELVFHLSGDSLEKFEQVNNYKVEYKNVSLTDGRIGKALSFDGTDGYVRINGVAKNKFMVNLDEPFTIEFWMKPDSSKPYNKCSEIINMGGDRGPGYRIFYFYRFVDMRSGEGYGNGKVFWDLRSNSSKNKIITDQWNHVAYVKKTNGIIKLYLNGKLAAASKTPLKIFPGARYMIIGNYPGGTNYPFKGAIDDIRFYKGSKSPYEILSDSLGTGSDLQIKVDGRLNEAFWHGAKEFNAFCIPPFGEKPKAWTKVKFKSDKNYIYFGITCDDPTIAYLKGVAQRNATGPVYRDDSVEIMLETENRGAEYYHFLVSAKGLKAQAIREQGGVVAVPWDNTNWMASTTINEAGKQWTAEFAIPYNILNSTILTENCSFNVVRNRRSCGKAEQSTLCGDFHNPSKFIKIRLDELPLNKFNLRLNRPQVTDMKQVKGGILATITVEFTGGHEGLLKAEGILASTKNPEVILSKKVECQYDSMPKLVEFNYLVSDPGKHLFTLKLSRGKTVTYINTTEHDLKFTLLTVKILQPFYRNNIYPGQEVKRLKTRINIGLSAVKLNGCCIQLQLKHHKTILENKEFSNIKPNADYELSLPDNLVCGNYKLVVSLLKSGKLIATTTQMIRKLPNCKGSQVIITPEGLNFNNRPIFPVVWWGGSPVSEIAKTGSFAVIFAPYGDLKAVLDEAERNGLKAAISIFGSKQFKIYVKDKTKIEADTRKYLTELIGKVKDHPALLYYYLADEPRGHGCDINLYNDIYKLLCKLDPYHPVLICNNTTQGIYDFKDACDIFCPDPYLLPLTKGTAVCPSKRPMSYLIDFMKAQKQAGEGRHLNGMTVQTFNYADFAPTHKDTRAPTFIELRSYHYMAIIYGARIFNYYKYGVNDPNLHTSKSGCFQYPDLRIGTIAMIKELKSLEAVLTTGEKMDGMVIADNKNIHCLALKYKNDYYIITVNGAPTTESVNFKLKKAITTNQLKLVSEDREITIKNNAFQDKFIPFGVHIYTTNVNYKNVIFLEQLKDNIKKAGGLFAVKY